MIVPVDISKGLISPSSSITFRFRLRKYIKRSSEARQKYSSTRNNLNCFPGRNVVKRVFRI